MATRRRALLLSVTVLFAIACSVTPTPVAQERMCGRLAQDECARVISAVEDVVPEARGSRLAIADYAELGPVASMSVPIDYFVAFAPWGGPVASGTYLSPPLWRVSETAGQWSLQPLDVTQVNVCFIEILDGAGLSDYMPPHPSGLCDFDTPAPAST